GQINMLSPAMLLKKLDRRLDILKGGFRNIPDRQKTLRRAIEWSFDLLSAEEQDLLLQMSLYHAGCLMSTVESIGAECSDIYTLLGSLIDKSLIMRQEEDFQVRF